MQEKKTDSSKRSLKGMMLVAIISLVSVAPVFLSHYIPCVDMPQHSGQVAAFEAMQHSANYPWSTWFTTHWFTPYLLGYLLMIGFSHLTNIVMASKIVVALALWGLPMSTALLLREVGNDPRLGFLTLPTLYGFTFSFGFLNFLIAIPIGLLFMAWLVRYQNNSNRLGFLVAAIGINLLFFCHVIIWGLFFGIALVFIWSKTSTWKVFLQRIAPLLSSLPLVLFWFVDKLLGTEIHGGGVGVTNFPLGWWRIDIFPLLIGSNRAVFNTGFGVFLLAAPWMLGYRLRATLSNLFPLLCCSLILFLGPHALFGISYIYERFAPLFIPFYLFALQPGHNSESTKSLSDPVWLGTLAFLVVFILNEVVLMSGFAAETADFHAVLTKMQPGQRTLSMVFMRNSLFSSAPVYLHFPLWYQATKDGLVDYNFGTGFMMLLQFNSNNVPANISGFEWNPQSFDWKRTQGYRYHYFMVRAPFNLDRFIFRSNICHIRLLTHAGTWWVYEQVAPTDSCPN